MAEIFKFTRGNERDKMREALREYLADMPGLDETEQCAERLLALAEVYLAPEYDFSVRIEIPADLPQALREAISDGFAKAIAAHRRLVDHAVRDRLAAEKRILQLEREVACLRQRNDRH